MEENDTLNQPYNNDKKKWKELLYDINQKAPLINEVFLSFKNYLIIGVLSDVKKDKEGNDVCVQSVILINENTNYIERVHLKKPRYFNGLYNILQNIQSHETLFDQFIEICIQENNYDVKYFSNLPRKQTKYHKASMWEIQDCFPFFGCRLKFLGSDNNDDKEENISNNLSCFQDKCEMFKGLMCDEKLQELFHDIKGPDEKEIYVIGHTFGRYWYIYPEITDKCFIIVVRGGSDKNDYEVWLLKHNLLVCSMNKLLLQKIPYENTLSYVDVLYGNYVVKMKWCEHFFEDHNDKKEREIIKLSDTPFYGKKLVNNKFIL